MENNMVQNKSKYGRIFDVSKIITAVKKDVEELANRSFSTTTNFDRRKINPNHYYFLFNDELNIEIVVSYGERNGMTNKDTLMCAIQKPISRSKAFDFRSIDTGTQCAEYIVESVKELLESITQKEES